MNLLQLIIFNNLFVSLSSGWLFFAFFFQELLFSLGSIQFSFGRAEVEDVTKCVGDVSVLYINMIYF